MINEHPQVGRGLDMARSADSGYVEWFEDDVEWFAVGRGRLGNPSAERAIDPA